MYSLISVMNILTPFCLLNTIIILHLKTVYIQNMFSTSVMLSKPSDSLSKPSDSLNITPSVRII